MHKDRKFRVAILDLYEGVPNQGMRCIREILGKHAIKKNIVLEVDEFEVRIAKKVPDLSYDMYISTGVRAVRSPASTVPGKLFILTGSARLKATMQTHSEEIKNRFYLSVIPFNWPAVIIR